MSLVNREDELNNQVNDIGTIKVKPKTSIFTKIKNITLIVFMLTIVGFIIYNTYRSSQELYIDNPTGTGIIIQINDMPEINLPAYSNKTIDLAGGNYTLKVDGEKVGQFEKKGLGGSTILNPTNSIYISEYVFYGAEKDYDNLPNNEIEAYGNEAEGPFKKYEGIYIKGTWDFGLDDKIPDTVEINKGKDYKIQEKLYRFDEFVNMYNENYVSSESDNAKELSE